VDGVTVDELLGYLKEHKTELLESIRTRKYKPQPVRRVEMLEIMRQYDSAMKARCPVREYFFPSPVGGCYQTTWVGNVFDEMWAKYNTAHATPYDLRHNYAVENINKWVG